MLLLLLFYDSYQCGVLQEDDGNTVGGSHDDVFLHLPGRHGRYRRRPRKKCESEFYQS